MTKNNSNTNNIVSRVEAALESIRPYLAADKGDIRILKITKNKNVLLEFIGSCSSCPMSSMTFETGVKEAIKSAVPEINEIKVTNMEIA